MSVILALHSVIEFFFYIYASRVQIFFVITGNNTLPSF